LPAPLPDDQALIDLWVQLATQRTFSAGDNIEWLDPGVLAALRTLGTFAALPGRWRDFP